MSVILAVLLAIALAYEAPLVMAIGLAPLGWIALEAAWHLFGPLARARSPERRERHAGEDEADAGEMVEARPLSQKGPGKEHAESRHEMHPRPGARGA
jgi:hypothetical protein